MNKRDYKNPEEHIFYCDKSDWYVEEENGNDIWDEEKCKSFWCHVREEKMEKNDYDFSDFVFPEFLKERFWKIEEEQVFHDYVIFTNAEFLGNAYFENVQFSGITYFTNARFLGTTYFRLTRFFGYISFDSAHFSEGVDLISTQFLGQVIFNKVKFLEYVYFMNSQFFEETDFQHSQFFGYANFKQTQFKDCVEFKGAHFYSDLYFNNCEFSYLKSLDTIDYIFEGAILEECNLYGINNIENVRFNHSFLLSLNLSYKIVKNCDFTGAMISGLIPRGWQLDEQTIQNTKYVYTDCKKELVEQEDGSFKEQYVVIEDSRIPAEGEFGVGEYEDFTIADYFRDPIKWSYALPLPKEIRTGFLNYIKFFEDFLLTTENEDIEIRTVREGSNVRVEFMVDNLEKKTFVEEKFGEYMANLTQDPSGLQVDYSRSPATQQEQKIFTSEYQTNIILLQQKVNYQTHLLEEKKKNEDLREDKIRLLEERLHFYEQAKHNPSALIQLPSPAPIPKVSSCQELKRKIAKGDIKGVFKTLDNLKWDAKENENTYYSLSGQFHRILRKEQSGQNTTDELAQLRSHLLSFLDDLEEEEVI